jgi:ribonuclease HII
VARSRPQPDLDVERALRGDGQRFIAGCDEVGRGALAGPVSVGVALVDLHDVSEPVEGLADSKLLSARQRHDIAPKVRGWVVSWGVGHATAQEIDDMGLTAALRLAGLRALARLDRLPDVVLLDGRHDWLSPPTQASWLDDDPGAVAVPPVVTRVGADRHCASVAAASVLAKVERDQIMIDLAASAPEYRWDVNKGYGSPVHLAALRQHGVSAYHRRSWRLPGVDVSDDTPSTSVTSPSDAGRLAR